MRGRLLAGAAAVLLAAGVIAPAAAAEGPRPSSLNNWPGIRDVPAAGAIATAASAEGPRASSSTNWPGIRDVPAASQQAATSAVHWLWQEGYDRGGKWHGHWVLVQ